MKARNRPLDRRCGPETRPGRSEIAISKTLFARSIAIRVWFPVGFDSQPTLNGRVVNVRPLRADDYPQFHAVASDRAIWEQHPVKNRYEDAVCKEFFAESLASGGALLVTDAETQEVIGSSRYSGYSESRREIEIGWTFLARSHWGGRYNGELKKLMLRHAFRFVEAVVFFVDPENVRSQRSLERVGAVREAECDSQGRIVYRIVSAALHGR